MLKPLVCGWLNLITTDASETLPLYAIYIRPRVEFATTVFFVPSASMAQFFFFVSVLVALISFTLLSTAAPLSASPQPVSTREFLWWAAPSPSYATATAAVATPTPKFSNIAIDFAPEGFHPQIQAEATVTHWETTTLTEQRAPLATPTPGSQAWVLSKDFEDLSPFGSKRIAYGSKNIAVVTGIPAAASAAPTPLTALNAILADDDASGHPLPRPWTNDSAVYRLFFPSGSINPGNKPQGGSDFYTSPLSLLSAANVTLEYSVFFPADFAWVHGGKLPGLYGGHGGCSGGDNAKSCFSTRMMWRQGGAGELYLYAPRDKQTADLCKTPPQSVCDSSYGLSVGRGSFHFGAGRWTHVRQTVRLNTPGRQDGGFELLINGERIMRRDDVFYRDVKLSSDDGENDKSDKNGGSEGKDKSDDGDGGNGNSGDSSSGGQDGGGDTSGGGSDGGLLGGLLGNLLKRATLRTEVQGNEVMIDADKPEIQEFDQTPLFAPERILPETIPTISPEPIPDSNDSIPAAAKTITLTTTVTETSIVPAATVASTDSQLHVESQSQTKSIGFSGIFFSTFFGGHEQSWASPKDQYIYFKDFGLTINS